MGNKAAGNAILSILYALVGNTDEYLGTTTDIIPFRRKVNNSNVLGLILHQLLLQEHILHLIAALNLGFEHQLYVLKLVLKASNLILLYLFLRSSATKD